jgi:hypothetical protein
VTDIAGRVGSAVSRGAASRRSTSAPWLASWPELAEDRPDACPPSTSSGRTVGRDRIVVLTGLAEREAGFDSIVVTSGRRRSRPSPSPAATLYVTVLPTPPLLTVVS